ncbi:hypothetical protein [Actinoallomurus sp. CA-150999]|uniref:hypothetical protein n=1 Tax=Actinoallomurus sp. CA-150999 TaxID=3239887 RepID=UPI003D9251F2
MVHKKAISRSINYLSSAIASVITSTSSVSDTWPISGRRFGAHFAALLGALGEQVAVGRAALAADRCPGPGRIGPWAM